MKKPKILSFQKNHGFTLVEFMIASTLGLIVIAAVGSLFMYTRKLNDIGQVRIAVQQDLRTAAMLITRDARMAGSFGCLSLGRLYSADLDTEDAKNFTITYSGAVMHGDGIAKVGSSASDPAGSAGVRWVKKVDIVSNTDIPSIKNNEFTPVSGALIFYYGSGSAGLTNVTGEKVTFVDNDPNQIVQNTVTNKGVVAITSCLAAQIRQADDNGMLFDIPASPGLWKDDKKPPQVNQQSVREISLMRYMVTAYMVGNVAGEPTSLYRFELQDNGKWGPPQLLARNVTAMTADYVFVPACPERNVGPNVNNYNFEIKSADDGNYVNSTDGLRHPPSAVNIVLTYGYPKALGQDTAAQMANNKFNIDANIRGGNLCANRKLLPAKEASAP